MKGLHYSHIICTIHICIHTLSFTPASGNLFSLSDPHQTQAVKEIMQLRYLSKWVLLCQASPCSTLSTSLCS